MARIRISYNAPVVLTFAILAVLVFLLPQDLRVRWFAAYPELGPTNTYVGLVSHILGHASWEHLLGNFMLILLIGPMLEERFGSFQLLIMILLTALVTGLINVVFSSNLLLGASGIAFMMILLASTANIRQGEIPLTFIAVAVIYLGGELVRAVRSDDQISQMAHLIGGATGAVFGFLQARARGIAPKSLVDKAAPGAARSAKPPAAAAKPR
ncbi:MAG: rhomboid family intramembrane serine protease [Kofleriaceae bacterium]